VFFLRAIFDQGLQITELDGCGLFLDLFGGHGELCSGHILALAWMILARRSRSASAWLHGPDHLIGQVDLLTSTT